MSQALLLAAFYGFLGGLARALIGFYKAYRAKKHHPFKWGYFFITVAGAALIGAFVAFALVVDDRISILAGYAGIDIIENLAKIYKKSL